MDLDFGHGFVPRIASQNYKAVDRCLGPDMLLDAPLDLPWAIVDAPWAEKNQDFLASLRAHGTKVFSTARAGDTATARRSMSAPWRKRAGPLPARSPPMPRGN